MHENGTSLRRRLALLIAMALAPLAGAEEFRSVWADAFSVGFKSQSQINTLISRCQAGNYNVIIAEVLAFHDNTGGGHGAYWNSSIVPKATDISGGIDPLANLVTAAHNAGIQVHAWIVPYRVSSVWPPSGNATLSGHPEWLMVPIGDIDGGPAKVGSYYTLDPGAPAAQDYLVGIVRELTDNYEIDGINLDYIRYVQTDAGYPSDAGYAGSGLARFQDLTGYVGTPPVSGSTSWNDFRRQTITEFVRRLRAEVATAPNPRQPLWLTADLIAFGNAPANFSSSDAYNLHQNWKYWLEEGFLDAGIVMNYKREFNASQAAWYRNWVNAANGWKGERYFVAGQGNYLNPKADSVTQMAYALGQGAEGTANFAYDATADENQNGTPETDWTWYPYVSANLWTTGDTVPVLPWRDPNTAIEGTLWGQVINEESGAPVDGAVVTVAGQPSVATDGNGYFVTTLIPASGAGTSYSVTVDAVGCPVVTLPGALIVPGGLTRADVVVCPLAPGDYDDDGDVDQADLNFLLFCLAGPDNDYVGGNFCLDGDFDVDEDIDLADVLEFQAVFDSP